MAQRHVLAGARLVADRADASPDAVDLSGPTPGPAVEVRVSQTLPAILYTPTGQGRTESPPSTPYLIVPARPGAALRALRGGTLAPGARRLEPGVRGPLRPSDVPDSVPTETGASEAMRGVPPPSTSRSSAS